MHLENEIFIHQEHAALSVYPSAPRCSLERSDYQAVLPICYRQAQTQSIHNDTSVIRGPATKKAGRHNAYAQGFANLIS